MRKRIVRPDPLTFIPPYLKRGFSPTGTLGIRTNALAEHRAEASRAARQARMLRELAGGLGFGPRATEQAAALNRRAASHRRRAADIVRGRVPRRVTSYSSRGEVSDRVPRRAVRSR